MNRQWNDVLVTSGIAAGYGFAVKAVLAVLSPYLQKIGTSDIWISIVFGMFPAGVVLFSPVTGRLSDTIGRYRLILAGIALEIISLTLYLIDGFIAIMLLARFLEAVAFGAVGLMSIAKVEDDVDDTSRGTYTGISMSIRSVGKLGGSLAGGYMADWFGILAPFQLSIGLLAILFIAYFFHENTESHSSTAADVHGIESIKTFLSHPGLQAMAVLGAFMHAKNLTISSFMPLLITDTLQLPLATVGTGLTILGISKLGQMVWGEIIDQYLTPSAFVLAGCAVTAVGLAVVSIADGRMLLFTGLFIHSLGSAFWNTAAWTFMSMIGERKDIEGQVVGSYMSIAKMGAVPAAAVNGFIAAATGYRFLFQLYAVLVLVAVIVAGWLLWRRSEG